MRKALHEGIVQVYAPLCSSICIAYAAGFLNPVLVENADGSGQLATIHIGCKRFPGILGFGRSGFLLGLNGFTVASGAHSKAYNPQIISVPLKLDDAIRVGLIYRSGIPLSAAGKAFAAAIRERITAK